MTFLYPELPPSGAAPTSHGQVSPEEFQPSPEPAHQKPGPNTTPPSPSDEYVRHILVGSPEALRTTIYLLHQRRYVEQAFWTGPVAIGPNGIQITRKEGEVLFYLMRRRSLDVPTG